MWPFITSNEYLGLEDMKINASYIYMRLINEGWTPQAIAGVLGNMQTESTINPGLWESREYGNMSGGYGLVQWTPATKYIDWANSKGYDITHINGQLNRILFEVDENIQWINPNMTFLEFTQSQLPPYDLAILFLTHYERPAEPNQPQRGEQANFWYEFITGMVPPDPIPPVFDINIITNRRFLPRRRGL